MATLKFDGEDRRFLRMLRINSEPTPEEIVIDALSEPTQYIPDTIIVTNRLAKLVIEEFGSLTPENIWAYLRKYQA